MTDRIDELKAVDELANRVLGKLTKISALLATCCTKADELPTLDSLQELSSEAHGLANSLKETAELQS